MVGFVEAGRQLIGPWVGIQATTGIKTCLHNDLTLARRRAVDCIRSEFDHRVSSQKDGPRHRLHHPKPGAGAMRYISMHKANRDTEAGVPPSPQLLAGMGQLME